MTRENTSPGTRQVVKVLRLSLVLDAVTHHIVLNDTKAISRSEREWHTMITIRQEQFI
jgi:hypothetical protein